MISPDSHFLLFSILFGVTAFGLIGESRSWFKGVAGALVIIGGMAILSNLGIVPSAADPNLSVPIYGIVFSYFVPLSIPLLLFGADVKRVVKESGRLIIIFLLGTLGIIIGAVVSFFLFDLGPNTYKVVSVFAATLIGGSVNFLGTAETLSFSSDPLFATSAAVDNLFANGFIFLLFLLPTVKTVRRKFSDPPSKPESSNYTQAGKTYTPGQLMWRLALCIAIAFSVCWLGRVIGSTVQSLLGTGLNLDILFSTLLVLLLANVDQLGLKEIADEAFALGMVLILVFLGVIGTMVSLSVVVEAGPKVIYICLTTLFIHLAFTMLCAKALGISLEEVAISSAANTAGPSISAPLAATIGQSQMVTPAILLGVLGYAIGTFIGVGLSQVLLALT